MIVSCVFLLFLLNVLLRVANPVCEKVGCGEWRPSMIPNPAYKGKWKPDLIANPDYDVSEGLTGLLGTSQVVILGKVGPSEDCQPWIF